MRENSLQVKRKSNYHRTTYSKPYLKYKNQISGREFTGVNQCWVSDITYIGIGARFNYLVLITDVYSKKVVGWSLNNTLQASGNVTALQMAISGFKKGELKGLIHHSDRGTQYGSAAYTKLLRSRGIRISMGSKAWENAHAERINGILKQEYIEPNKPKTVKILQELIRKSIKLYHEERPHWSLPGMSTPSNFIRMLADNMNNYKLTINY